MLAPDTTDDFVFDPGRPRGRERSVPDLRVAARTRAGLPLGEGRAFLISRHADVAQLLRDRRFSTNPRDWIHAPPLPSAGPIAEFSTAIPHASSFTLQPDGTWRVHGDGLTAIVAMRPGVIVVTIFV